MHKIERLLQTLAPKGVEFRKLGEVCGIIRGKRVTKKEILDKGKYPVVSGGIGFMGYLNEYNREENTITIAQYGTAGFVNWQNQKFWANDVCFSVIPKETLINRYLYYVLTNMQNYLYSISNRSAIPYSISSNNIMQITIPIPPLEIQQEIVKILDAFTELNTELNTELKARKKQYQYYQNMLLDFNDINQNHQDAKERLVQKTYPKRLKSLLQTLAPKGVEFRKLGEVCESANKKTLKISEVSEVKNKGMYPVINSGRDLYGYCHDFNNDGENITIASRGEYAGFINYFNEKFFAGGLCYPYKVKDTNELLTKFLYFYLKTNEIQIMENLVSRGSIPALNKADIETLTIPIPPLEIQQEIVKILDQFSILTTDLLAGIPAEIEARKKQYEYYREKLLTFKPLTPHKEVKKC
ncbi:restriction endonuclease subunit S [Helicobacter pylori]